MTSEFASTVSSLVRARFPLLYVQTWEELRVLQEVWAAVRTEPRLQHRPRDVLLWRSTTGLSHLVEVRDGRTPIEREISPNQTRDPVGVLSFIREYESSAVVLLFDYHWFLRPGARWDEQMAIRALRDLASRIKTGSFAKTVVLVSPTLAVPDELQKDVTIVEFALPDEAALDQALQRLIDDNRDRFPAGPPAPQVRRHLVKAALGLTLTEADNAFALALATRGTLDLESAPLIRHEKRQAVRRAGLLDYMEESLGFEDIGGLDALRSWLKTRARAWLDDSTLNAYRLPFPKGVLITGVPGCGKSMTAKCTSVEWGLPLLRLDMGRIFSRYVGSSEENLRTAIQVAEAVAPCILFIDEVEKGMSGGSAGSPADSGVARRLFGTFLTWLQEKTKPVFVIATANDITALPPEFLRKGRFDEIFFVDLPDARERAEIWRIYLDRLRAAPRASEGLPFGPAVSEALAARSAGFGGAEIEQALHDALFHAYAQERPLTLEDIERVLAVTHPLSETSEETIVRLRAWAQNRAVSASAPRNGGGRDFQAGHTGRFVETSGS